MGGEDGAAGEDRRKWTCLRLLLCLSEPLWPGEDVRMGTGTVSWSQRLSCSVMMWGASLVQVNAGEVRKGEATREGGTGADLSSGKERPEGIVY